MDTGPEKEAIIQALTAHGVPFIDTGVGLSKDPNGINGQIRITTSTPGRTEHIERDGLISYFAGEDAEYDTNLQVAELNALTANLAVMRYRSSSASTPTSRTSGTPCTRWIRTTSTTGTAPQRPTPRATPARSRRSRERRTPREVQGADADVHRVHTG
jgi:hypothetical protein